MEAEYSNYWENMEAEYNNYWETRMFFENQELDSWGLGLDLDLDEGFSSYHNSSSGSPDGAGSPNGAESLDEARTLSSPAAADKNIVMERNRRKRYNERLYALRSEVPNITKMDKASIIKDAIGYIQELQEQERKMVAEITELELRSQDTSPISEITQDDCSFVHSSRKKLKRSTSSTTMSTFPRLVPIKLCTDHVLELKVCEVGENSHVISITCNNKEDTMMDVCKLFDSLDLKVMNANITTIDGSLLHTLFVEGAEMSSAQLKEKIELSIVEHDFHSD
ncbi:transcription factor bHLH35-like [Iris pallida]|uniref:Transcription factor bHLH35-like n=1 Tax=Iris pallida TaxID=29817 RepID=A0AAX6IM56_IRIPA|nr:transcription factor bHLH35-like [Iris pallida]